MPLTWQRQRRRRGRPNQSLHLVRRFLEGVTTKKETKFFAIFEDNSNKNRSQTNSKSLTDRPQNVTKSIQNRQNSSKIHPKSDKRGSRAPEKGQRAGGWANPSIFSVDFDLRRGAPRDPKKVKKWRPAIIKNNGTLQKHIF